MAIKCYRTAYVLRWKTYLVMLAVFNGVASGRESNDGQNMPHVSDHNLPVNVTEEATVSTVTPVIQPPRPVDTSRETSSIAVTTMTAIRRQGTATPSFNSSITSEDMDSRIDHIRTQPSTTSATLKDTIDWVDLVTEVPSATSITLRDTTASVDLVTIQPSIISTTLRDTTASVDRDTVQPSIMSTTQRDTSASVDRDTIQPSTTFTFLRHTTASEDLVTIQPSTTSTTLRDTSAPVDLVTASVELVTIQPSTTPNTLRDSTASVDLVTIQPSTTPNTLRDTTASVDLVTIQPSTTPNPLGDTTASVDLVTIQPSTTPNTLRDSTASFELVTIQSSTTPNTLRDTTASVDLVTIQPSTTPNTLRDTTASVDLVTEQPSTTPNTLRDTTASVDLVTIHPSTTPNTLRDATASVDLVTELPSTTPNTLRDTTASVDLVTEQPSTPFTTVVDITSSMVTVTTLPSTTFTNSDDISLFEVIAKFTTTPPGDFSSGVNNILSPLTEAWNITKLNTGYDLTNEDSMISDLNALSTTALTDSGDMNTVEEATEDGNDFRLILNMTKREPPPSLGQMGLQAAKESIVKTYTAEAGPSLAKPSPPTIINLLVYRPHGQGTNISYVILKNDTSIIGLPSGTRKAQILVANQTKPSVSLLPVDQRENMIKKTIFPSLRGEHASGEVEDSVTVRPAVAAASSSTSHQDGDWADVLDVVNDVDVDRVAHFSGGEGEQSHQLSVDEPPVKDHTVDALNRAPEFAPAAGQTSTHLNVSVDPSVLDLDFRLDPNLDQEGRVAPPSLPGLQELEGSSEGGEETETVLALTSKGQGLAADEGFVFVTPIALDPSLDETGYLIPAKGNGADSSPLTKRVGQFSDIKTLDPETRFSLLAQLRRQSNLNLLPPNVLGGGRLPTQGLAGQSRPSSSSSLGSSRPHVFRSPPSSLADLPQSQVSKFPALENFPPSLVAVAIHQQTLGSLDAPPKPVLPLFTVTSRPNVTTSDSDRASLLQDILNRYSKDPQHPYKRHPEMYANHDKMLSAIKLFDLHNNADAVVNVDDFHFSEIDRIKKKDLVAESATKDVIRNDVILQGASSAASLRPAGLPADANTRFTPAVVTAINTFITSITDALTSLLTSISGTPLLTLLTLAGLGLLLSHWFLLSQSKHSGGYGGGGYKGGHGGGGGGYHRRLAFDDDDDSYEDHHKVHQLHDMLMEYEKRFGEPSVAR